MDWQAQGVSIHSILDTEEWTDKHLLIQKLYTILFVEFEKNL